MARSAMVVGVGWLVGAGMGMGAGCRPAVPLTEAPIVGGTDVQRALVAAELAAVDVLAGPGRVRVSEVAFTDVGSEHVAEYNSVSHRVKIGPVEDGEVRGAVRHELCHAMDYREDLAPGSADLDRLAAFYRMTGLMDETRRSAWRREAFALLCGTSAVVTAALAEPCDGDPEPVTDLAPWVLETAWPAWPADDATADVRRVGDLRTDLSAVGGFDDGDAWLSDGGGSIAYFDPGAARWVAPSDAVRPVSGDPVDLPGWFGDVTAAGWSDGRAAAVLAPLPEGANRLLVRDGDGAWAGAGCLGDPALPFVTPGHTWVASEQGGDAVELWEVR